MTVLEETWEKIQEEFCDFYCRMPNTYNYDDLEDICEGCPFEKVKRGDYEHIQ